MRRWVLVAAMAITTAMAYGCVAQEASVAAAVSTQAVVPAQFAGRWAGQLEYRDYTTNERTALPTWAETSVEPGETFVLRYTYDDGPAKVVREVTRLRLAGQTATITSDDGKPGTTYAVSGLEAFRNVGRGKLVLTGAGIDNGKAVDVRLTITLRRNLYTWVKEVKATGGVWEFRDGYTMTRVEVPKG